MIPLEAPAAPPPSEEVEDDGGGEGEEEEEEEESGGGCGRRNPAMGMAAQTVAPLTSSTASITVVGAYQVGSKVG